MRVKLKTVSVRIYVFTEKEQQYLIDMEIWGLIVDRLRDNERIEIER